MECVFVFVCDFSLRFWVDFFRLPFVSVCSRRHKLTQLVKVCPYFPHFLCSLSPHSFVRSPRSKYAHLWEIVHYTFINCALESQTLALALPTLWLGKAMDAKISSWKTQFRVSNTNRESCKLFAFNLNTNLKYAHADFQIYGKCTYRLVYYICWHKTYWYDDIAAAATVAVDDDLDC